MSLQEKGGKTGKGPDPKQEIGADEKCDANTRRKVEGGETYQWVV